MSGTELKINEIDQRLTGNPQITFFKSVYRRHTYFLKIIKEYTISSNNNEVNTEIMKDVDLISDIYIKTTLSSINTSSTKIYANLGNNIVEEIKLMADGNRTLYETHGLWMETLAELENPYIPIVNGNYNTPPVITTNSTNKLTVNSGNLYNISCFAGGVSGSNSIATSASSTEAFFTRPNFDFCRSYEKSFPLCALNNTKISLNIKFRGKTEYISNQSHNRNSKIMVEGIILSLDEKRRIVANTKPYIFFNYGIAQIDNSAVINSVGPVRSIYIVGKLSSSQSDSLSLSTPAELQSGLKIKYDLNGTLETTEALDLRVYTLENIYRYYDNGGFGGRELSSSSPSKNLGHFNSIGIITQSLEPANEPNGHFSASDKITITPEPSNGFNNVEIFYEYINYYRIMGGQINTLYQ
jgi:hypothetical protein